MLWKSPEERRTAINAIAPVWDGNEVWLLAAGGALFAAFPPVYATVFSGFYIALVLLLLALMGRAIAIEFRAKVESPRWQRTWDIVFFLGSALIPLLLGVALGNVMKGLPIDQEGNFTGTFLSLLNPYALVIGLLALALFLMHGAIYLVGKIDGQQQRRTAGLIVPLWCVFCVLHVVAAAATAWVAPFLYESIYMKPLFWLLSVLWLFGGAMTPYFATVRRYGSALASSGMTVAAMVGLVGVGLFPQLVPSSMNLNWSLTATNSSSTPQTLRTMLVIALIGMPIVLTYTALVYGAFKGKAQAHDQGY